MSSPVLPPLDWTKLGRDCLRKHLRQVFVVGSADQALLWLKSWLQLAPCEQLVVVSQARPSFLFPIPSKSFRWAEVQHLTFHEGLSIATSLDRRPTESVVVYEELPVPPLTSLISALSQIDIRTFILLPTLYTKRLKELLTRPDTGVLYLQNNDFETSMALSEQTQSPLVLDRLSITEALWCETTESCRLISLASVP